MLKKTRIAIDAMGGENSPKKIIEAIKITLNKNQENFFYLFGQQDKIKKEIDKNRSISKYCEIINTNDVISDHEGPLGAAKKWRESSMWKAIESQKDAKCDITLSAGNTGALLVISRLILNTIDGINKPALAGLWPNNNGMSVVLDLGANIECNEKNLIDFTTMGSALFKSLFNNESPRVALLNVGLEENKGNDILKKTYSILKEKKTRNFEFCGYIEGTQIMDGNVDVIITDGFTGNVALKTAEGTANFITSELKQAMKSSIFSKLGSLISMNSLKKFKKKLDPRLYNGAILLGLDSPVIKSHGGTDYFGFSNSLSVCNKVISGNLIQKIKQKIN